MKIQRKSFPNKYSLEIQPRTSPPAGQPLEKRKLRNIREHVRADEYLLGYSNPAIHSMLDINSKIFGPAHRFDNHNYKTVMLVDSLFGKTDGDIALLHILLDLHIINDKIVSKIIKDIVK